MTTKDRITAANNRIAKAQKTLEMYNKRISKKIENLQKKGIQITEENLKVSYKYGWANVELDAELRNQLEYDEYSSLVITAQDRYNKQKCIENELKLIATLNAEIEAKEETAKAKEETEAPLKNILTEAMQEFKTAWMTKMQNYFQHHYDYIISKTPTAKIKYARLKTLDSYFQPRTTWIGCKRHTDYKNHSRLHAAILNNKSVQAEIIADEANSYDTLESYMNMINKSLENKWQSCIDNLTTKCLKYSLDQNNLSIGQPMVTSKGFEIWIEDGKNRRIYARIIWAAEYSEYMQPHTRYIITEKKL